MAVHDSLAPESVVPVRRGRFGSPYLYEPVCESTQLLLLGSGLPEGAVAVADYQSGGRGRVGRPWVAPPGTALLASVLLHPPANRHLPELSLVAALATAEAVEAAADLSAQVKWPNDVMVNRRKVAGILSELSEGVVVVGVGINVNQARDELPADAPTPPASLRTLTGRAYDRARLLDSLLDRFERRYDEWGAGGLAALYEDLGPRDFLRGRRVDAGGAPGTAVQIHRDGRLEVRTDGGETLEVESGEIGFVR